jgi:nucleoid-associated protein YgaU
MFSSRGSRYQNVKEYAAGDGSAGLVTVKRNRETPPTPGVFSYRVQEGDRLDLIANKFYRNPGKWWLIADANPDVMYPEDLLLSGQTLIVPPDRMV